MGFSLLKWGLIGVVFILAACGEEEGTTWNASLPWSIREYHTQNANDFSKAVAELTNGEIDIKVFPGGVLGLKGPETIRALREGLVDLASVPAVQEAGNEPALALESLPFLIQDQEELRLLYSLSRPKIERDFEKKGLKILYIVPWPRQNLYMKEKVTSLSQIQGLKIRTYDRNSSEMMERLGLVPLQMPSSDVVPALASGMVDAAMTSTTTGAAQGFWQFLPYIYRTNHLWLSNIFAVSLESWDALDPMTQNGISDLAQKMEQTFWEIAAQDDLNKLEILVKNGVEVIEVNEEFKIEMQQASKPMWQAYLDRVDPETGAILKEFLAQTGKDLGR